MDAPARTTAEINDRVANGRAVVWSASSLLEEGRANVPVADVDIVTIAFESSLSGTAAMVCVPVAGRGVFTRAEAIWLNGIRGTPGPAPNERLGIVDTMILADDQRDEDGPPYDGAALLLDLLEGNEIDVDCLAAEGTRYAAKVTLSDLEFARFYVYNAFVDGALPAPVLGALGRGSRVLLNGAQGIIVGHGTRDGSALRSLSLAADMYAMDASLMRGLEGTGRDGTGNMIALAVPILDEAVLGSLVAWTASCPPTGPRDAAACQVRDGILGGTFTLTDTDFAI